MSSKIHVFTHHDLDGLGSLLTLTWLFPEEEITYTTVNNHTFHKIYTEWVSKHDIKTYKRIFITDLCVPKEHISLIDISNVIYIDHHRTSLDYTFTKAKSFIKETTSCTLYIYKIFKSLADITDDQKHLIALIDDYDCYKLQFANSRKLNILFWNFYSNKPGNFLTDFENGFKKFNDTQQTVIRAAESELINLINNLQLYTTDLNIQNQKCKCISTFANTSINDVAEHILRNLNADIAIVVNLKNERVSFRRSSTCAVDISLLVQSLCKGGGHQAAGGGDITESFLTFAKLFTPLLK